MFEYRNDAVSIRKNHVSSKCLTRKRELNSNKNQHTTRILIQHKSQNTNDVFFFFSICIKLVDESTPDPLKAKRAFRRESLVDDYRNRSNSFPDETQSSRIILFPRRNVILLVT